MHAKYNENGVKIFQGQFDEIRDLAFYELSRRGALSAFKYLDKTFTSLNPKIAQSKQGSDLTTAAFSANLQSEVEGPAVTSTSIGTSGGTSGGGSY